MTTQVASPKAPTKDVAPKTPVAPTFCKCGCGATTVRPEAKYVAGHDARHAGQVGRSTKSDAEVREIFKDSPKLAAKALRVRETASAKVAAKAEAKALREELAAKLAEVKAAHAK